MASTMTTESRSALRDRRNAVPLLLSSFPAPPTHIPASPFTPLSTPISVPTSASSGILNPPPSLPPSSPLPPVPGPSPITEHETLMFISAARSRRASKLSLASSSSYSRRNSTATLASNGSGSNASVPSLSLSVSATPVDSSTRSLRTLSSNGSLPTCSRLQDKSPTFEPRIREEDAADLSRMSLDEIIMHSPVSDSEYSDDEKVLEVGLSASGRRRHAPNDSISSIDMQDLPPLHEDEVEMPIAVPALSPVCPEFANSPKRSSTSSRINKDLPPLPTEARGPSTSTAPPDTQRSDSPDIQTILATTPRPRRKSSTSALSTRSRSASRSRSSRSALRRHVSEGISMPRSRIHKSDPRRTSEASLPLPERRGRPGEPGESMRKDARDVEEFWNDDSFVSDYGTPLDGTGTPMELFDKEEEDRLERELEGDGSDTDSSLDIHTPLPNLMLRDGLLSPHSKLLPQSQQASPNGRPGSLMSIASTVGSVMTKSGLYKDERDTQKRRCRHRDGKLLRGGIGLTTGLGWSDSEDEDAPSPLTRQLSSTSLSRKSLPSSLRSSHPLSRSVSAASIDTHSTAETGAGRHRDDKGRASFPLDRTRRLVPVSLEQKISLSSAGSASLRGFGPQSHASALSLRSASSSGRKATLSSAHLDHINEREETSLESPSSSSSASLPMPLTPVGSDVIGSNRTSGASLLSQRSRKMSSEFDRHFPTDPASHISAVSSKRTPFTRSTSAGSSIATSMSTPPSSYSGPKSAQVPRPLRLSQQSILRRAPDGSYRPTVSTGSAGKSGIGTINGNNHCSAPTASKMRQSDPTSLSKSSPSPALGLPRSGSRDMTLHNGDHSTGRDIAMKFPSVPDTKLRPRTGTGMTYRSSSNPAARPSMMRTPSSTRLNASYNTDVGVAI
ncbi:uncharacterized protein FIBRA_00742 [Fibroporia radiculosa]|uniref:Uncharacterized protein n=1 Tax=Fibroporia radiculosa TaxID=599839 RepID=J4HS42_9APHY|nr:uncharacterized protein FIBRA_00742 [Fibroporia radiculosa]CCL98737.1 predicted protein [Fibroporia radiculosa]